MFGRKATEYKFNNQRNFEEYRCNFTFVPDEAIRLNFTHTCEAHDITAIQDVYEFIIDHDKQPRTSHKHKRDYNNADIWLSKATKVRCSGDIAQETLYATAPIIPYYTGTYIPSIVVDLLSTLVSVSASGSVEELFDAAVLSEVHTQSARSIKFRAGKSKDSSYRRLNTKLMQQIRNKMNSVWQSSAPMDPCVITRPNVIAFWFTRYCYETGIKRLSVSVYNFDVEKHITVTPSPVIKVHESPSCKMFDVTIDTQQKCRTAVKKRRTHSKNKTQKKEKTRSKAKNNKNKVFKEENYYDMYQNVQSLQNTMLPVCFESERPVYALAEIHETQSYINIYGILLCGFVCITLIVYCLMSSLYKATRKVYRLYKKAIKKYDKTNTDEHIRIRASMNMPYRSVRKVSSKKLNVRSAKASPY